MRKLATIISVILLISNIVCLASDDRNIIQVDLKPFWKFIKNQGPDIRNHLDMISMDKEHLNADVLSTEKGRLLLDSQGIPWHLVKTSQQIREDRIDPLFYNYDEVNTALSGFESSYPSLMQKVSIAETFENRRVWAAKISDNVTMEENEPAVLFIGLHQAREIMSTEIAMDIIAYLLENFAGDPDVQEWVSNWEIWVIPMLNPDGSAYCWSDDQYWIKNRRDFGNDIFGVCSARGFFLSQRELLESYFCIHRLSCTGIGYQARNHIPLIQKVQYRLPSSPLPLNGRIS